MINTSNEPFHGLRNAFYEIIEFWGNASKDCDLLDFPEYVLPKYMENIDSFKLYRYLPPTYYAIRSIEKQIIHLSENGIMNDVYEGIPLCKISPDSKVKLDELSDVALMACFSETPSNPLMWSHYADSSRGFCVEYDIKRLKKHPFDLRQHLFPVLYSEKRLFSHDLEMLVESHRNLKRAIQESDDYDGPLEYDDVLPLFIVKGIEWAYEQEWRIVLTKKQLFYDNPSLAGKVNYPFECISAIYLGYRTRPEIKENIIEICERLKEKGQSIDVFQMNLSENDYTLTKERIYPDV